ncbi:MAG TPA: hypothetical protein VM238_18360 [Phycisphaerae bacterium]|nr:hypothetical protein [Phycisphaerae bacterium]
MAIDTDRLTLARVGYSLVTYFAPTVVKFMFTHSPQAKFMTNQGFEFNAGDYMKFSLQRSRDTSTIIGNIQSKAWPNAGRSYGKRLEIAPSNLKEMMSSIKLDIKDQALMKKGGATVENQLREQMVQIREDAARKADFSTMVPSTGVLANIAGATYASTTLTMTVDTPGAQFLYPGLHICGGGASFVAESSTTIKWHGEIESLNRNTGVVKFVAAPANGTGTTVASATMANNDLVFIYDAAASTACAGYYNISTFMTTNFTAYNIGAASRTSATAGWTFFNPTVTSGTGVAVTLEDVEDALTNHDIQARVVPDLGICYPTIYKTLSRELRANQRFSLAPDQMPDYVQGFNHTWIAAGKGRVPIVPDATMWADRMYFLKREDWKRVLLQEWGFVDQGNAPGAAGIWQLDNDYGFYKARGWSSFNYVCMRPDRNLTLDTITA